VKKEAVEHFYDNRKTSCKYCCYDSCTAIVRSLYVTLTTRTIHSVAPHTPLNAPRTAVRRLSLFTLTVRVLTITINKTKSLYIRTLYQTLQYSFTVLFATYFGLYSAIIREIFHLQPRNYDWFYICITYAVNNGILHTFSGL
jgi:hypothetical protein